MALFALHVPTSAPGTERLRLWRAARSRRAAPRRSRSVRRQRLPFCGAGRREGGAAGTTCYRVGSASRLGAAPQEQSRRADPPPRPAGHTSFDATRDAVGLLGCKHILLARVESSDDTPKCLSSGLFSSHSPPTFICAWNCTETGAGPCTLVLLKFMSLAWDQL